MLKNTKSWLSHSLQTLFLPYILYFHIFLHVSKKVLHLFLIFLAKYKQMRVWLKFRKHDLSKYSREIRNCSFIYFVAHLNLVFPPLEWWELPSLLWSPVNPVISAVALQTPTFTSIYSCSIIIAKEDKYIFSYETEKNHLR